MRNLLPPFLILVLSFSGCTRNNSPASPGGNNPPPCGTPGTNGITVTWIKFTNYTSICLCENIYQCLTLANT